MGAALSFVMARDVDRHVTTPAVAVFGVIDTRAGS